MKKILLSAFALLVSAQAYCGGFITNTNNSAFFHRMMARGASTDIDAVYYNPAGLAWLNHEGLSLAFSYQYAYQHRDIDASYTTYPGDRIYKYYKGRAEAPFLPSLYAAYKKGNWAFSGSFVISGGGGTGVFKDGLPMFDSAVQAKIYAATGGMVNHNMYDLDSYMEGSSLIFALQMGATYKFSDNLSGYAGMRIQRYKGGVKGHLNANLKDQYAMVATMMGLQNSTIASVGVDCEQTAWGFSPVLGLDAKFGAFTIGAKYEFKTKFSLTNNTSVNTDPQGALASYADGLKSRNDMPALATLGVGYDFTSWLRAQAQFNYYFDKDATMPAGKQKYLTHDTNEYLFGVEADITSKLLVSAGVQFTDYGLAPEVQNDASFSCDSYSIGLGAAYKFTDKLRLTAGYFWTTYKDNMVESANFNKTGLPGFVTYKRTNSVLGLTLDYAF